MNFDTVTNSPYFYHIVTLILIISLALIIYFTMKKETAEDTAPLAIETVVQAEPVEPVVATEDLSTRVPEPTQNNEPLMPSELLPNNDAAASFEQRFPSGEGEATDKNFLIAGYNIGINTVGSSHKNPNLQLRSDPYVPRKEVGPWNQSTIMASDITNRRELNIGS
jgi:hypothetical protein